MRSLLLLCLGFAMVLLTQTPAILSALESYHAIHLLVASEDGDLLTSPLQKVPSDPPLSAPSLGAPISHGQVLDLYQALQEKATTDAGLESTFPRLPALLHGSTVYIPPPPPKPQPSSEYVALMARLRSEAAAADYNRMLTSNTVSPASSSKNPFGKFVAPSNFQAWDIGTADSSSSLSKEAEEESMKEINAQLSLIVNVLVSVIACGCTFFILLGYTRWSNEIKTLASMFGALIVGIAEVVIYVGFIRRLGEAKAMNQKERKRKEERSVEETWVIESKSKGSNSTGKSVGPAKPSWELPGAETTRQRKAKAK